MSLFPGRAVCEASLDEKKWEKIGETRIRGTPKALRLGKLSRDGGAGDFPENGNLERCRVARLRIFTGAEPAPATAAGDGVSVEVHYELYDGIPLLSKWLVVRNGGDKPIRLNSFTAEILAVVEAESYVDTNPRWDVPSLHVETDYSFGGMGTKGGNKSVHWVADPSYTSQVNYDLRTPCLLECRPPRGPDQIIPPGGSLESFRIFELAHDSPDRERRGLAQRRFYRTIAPWVTENPVLMHVRSAAPEAVRLAVDQCAEIGFEMVIMTFWSGFDFENRDKAYQAQDQGAGGLCAVKRPRPGRLLAPGQPRRGQGGRQLRGPVNLRGHALPGSAVGRGLPAAAQGFHDLCRPGGAGARRLLSRRYLRFDQSPVSPRPRRLPMGAVARHHRPLQVVPQPGRLPERPGLVFSGGQLEDRHGLSRGELVAAARIPGDHRAAEHLRRHLGEDAVDGLDVRASDGIPGRRSRGHHRTAQGPPASLRNAPGQPVWRGCDRLLSGPEAL